MYKNVKACVRTPSAITDFFTCSAGVQQGSVLSPLLFNIFVNDIGEALSDTTQFSGVNIGILKILYLLYADDLTLVSHSRIGLQRLLNNLFQYCCKWKLKVNLDKSNIIVFRRGGRLKQYEKWYYDNEPMSVTSSQSYLGVVFSWSGSWFQAQKTLSEQGNKALFALKSCLRKFGTIPVTTSLKIFDCKINPILLYGSEIWGFHSSNEIEAVYNKIMRFTLKLYNKTSIFALRGELGRVSLRVYKYCRIIKYWVRLLNMDKHRLTYKCYEFQYANADSNSYNFWAKSVKSLLQNYGFGEVWLQQGVGDVNVFLTVFKQRCVDIDKQNWSDEIHNSSKLDTYSLFKNNLTLEPYLTVIENPLFRTALCRFRTSTHSLEVETGRVNNVLRGKEFVVFVISGLWKTNCNF